MKNQIDKLESFVSKNGAVHYNLKFNKEKIKLHKIEEKLVLKHTYKCWQRKNKDL